MRSLLVLIMLALPAFGQDNSGLDRLTTREDLRGFEAVGRIDIQDGGFCTGTLVAADLVLTAAHCLFDDDQQPIPAGRITFRAGLADGTSVVDAQVAQTVVHPDYRPVEPSPLDQIKIDVGLLKLVAPIPTSQIAPFAITVPGAGDEVSVVSYAAGRAEALSWQRACQVVARYDSLIAVDCDVTFGSSGAPVLDRSAGYRAKIVSLISVGSTYDGKPVAVGMELPDLVDFLKRGLRSGRATTVAEDELAPRTAGKRIVIGEGNDTGARFVKP
ncbi:MAG: trypsin-like peptidase domain-containing protein [Tabrizicola sp.]|jgi:protease YdgD|nr:trypsin-like peptidase domain-containing protein [Tabrizicola sp.]